MTHAVVPPAMSSAPAIRKVREAAVKRVNVGLRTAGCLAHSERLAQRFRQPLSSALEAPSRTPCSFRPRLVPLPQSPAAAESRIFSPRPR